MRRVNEQGLCLIWDSFAISWEEEAEEETISEVFGKS